MSWKELLQKPDEKIVLPWCGTQTLIAPEGSRVWDLERAWPPEHGWYEFVLNGRRAHWNHSARKEPKPEIYQPLYGYLVGDRFVPDLRANLNKLFTAAERLEGLDRVFCIEPGLDHFARVSVGDLGDADSYVYLRQEMPTGAEDEVRQAFLDRADNLGTIKHVHPALHLAFNVATFQRAKTEERRRELIAKREEEERQRALEARREELRKQLGDGAGRRALAHVDFETAARAALAVGGATLLDARMNTEQLAERVVRFRFAEQRFECVCDLDMRIVDAGVCLQDHRTGRKGDRDLTLESLPGVLQQAIDEHRLVKWRHG